MVHIWVWPNNTAYRRLCGCPKARSAPSTLLQYLAVLVRHVGSQPWQSGRVHCKYLNARFVCSDIVITVYSHYPFDQNAKTFDTKGKTFSIRWFCILIERVMTVYRNYDVIAFKSCIQIFTVYLVIWLVTFWDINFFGKFCIKVNRFKEVFFFWNEGMQTNWLMYKVR